MSWGSIIASVLGLITSIISLLNSKKMMKAGEDAAVARAALKVLEATDEGKRLYNLVSGLDEVEADSLWKRMLRDDPPV